MGTAETTINAAPISHAGRGHICCGNDTNSLVPALDGTAFSDVFTSKSLD